MADAGSPVGLGAFMTWGHAAALESVARGCRTERPPHALLIVGPRGVGKTTLALDLAADSSAWLTIAAVRPCRACPACRRVETGSHPDVHAIAPEGAGEQIRLGQVQQLGTDWP